MADADAQRTLSIPISKTLRIDGRQVPGVSEVIEISADSETLATIETDKPLDPSIDAIRFTAVKPALPSDKRSIDFSGGRGTVTFSTTTGTTSGLGVYTDPTAMLEDMASLSNRGERRLPFDKIPFADIPADRYFAFYWDYNTGGSADGTLALAPESMLHAEALDTRNLGFSVIRAYAVNPPALTALKDLFGKSWILPNQVRSVDDLQPGTWLLSEVTGSFSANLGVDFGFDFNRVHDIVMDAADTFAGDIGLKVRTGAEAAFSLNAGGRFLLIVGRDSLNPEDRVVRIRLYNLDRRGRNVTLNARLSLDPSPDLLRPDQLDDFIAAVLGVHGLQILEEVRYWTDPERRMSELASSLLTDFAVHQLGKEFEENVETIRQTVIDWLNKWDELPAAAASALWDAIRLDRDSLDDFLTRIRRLADPSSSEKELQELMAEAGFAFTPIGRWLIAVTQKRILSVITNAPEAAKVRKAASITLDVIQGRLLDALKDFVETKVGFPMIRKAVKENDFESLTKLAQKQLSRFLGKSTPLDAVDIRKIRELVHSLLDRGADLYRSSLEALDRTYRLSFDYTCSNTATRTALLDISFDFGANSDLFGELEKAVAGDFTEVLPAPGRPAPKGVTFNDAILTHRIQRRAHVRIILPHLSSDTTHETSVEAGYRIQSEEGSVCMYRLDAEDSMRQAEKWNSSLLVSLNLAFGSENNIRQYDKDHSSATIDYRFVQAIQDLHTLQLARYLDLLSKPYFKDVFTEGDESSESMIHSWAAALDTDSDGNIGNSILTLDVSLPGNLLLNWFHAPEDMKHPVYMEMSRRFQIQLRRFIPLLYFQDPNKYSNLDIAWPLLMYASLPVTTSIVFDAGTLYRNTDRELYWDWPDEQGERRHLTAAAVAREKLFQTLDGVARLLSGIPKLRHYADHYDPKSQLNAVRSSIASNPGKFLLEGLLYTEATIIESAAGTGHAIARFRTSTDKVTNTIGMLNRFGSALVETFHAKLTTIFDPDDPASRHTLRNLGLLLFSEMTAALDPESGVRPTAALEIMALKRRKPFPPRGFPSRIPADADMVRIRRRILSLGGRRDPHSV